MVRRLVPGMVSLLPLTCQMHRCMFYYPPLCVCRWVILVCAAGVALILGFVWLMLAKWCTGIFVWGTIYLLLFVLSILTGYLYYKVRAEQGQLNI
jgi:hypothetical protein